MKEYSVELLPEAWNSLKKIEDYYTIQFGAETAIMVSDSILDALKRLERYPNSGVETPSRRLNDLGFQMIVIKHHVALYLLVENNVYIHLIADSRTEYTKLVWRMISDPGNA